LRWCVFEGGDAYLCKASQYEMAMKHPEAGHEVGFPLEDVKINEAGN
jgi:hypothetical protein